MQKLLPRLVRSAHQDPRCQRNARFLANGVHPSYHLRNTLLGTLVLLTRKVGFLGGWRQWRMEKDLAYLLPGTLVVHHVYDPMMRGKAGNGANGGSNDTRKDIQ